MALVLVLVMVMVLLMLVLPLLQHPGLIGSWVVAFTPSHVRVRVCAPGV